MPGEVKGKNSVRDDYRRNTEHLLSAYKLSFAHIFINGRCSEVDLG